MTAYSPASPPPSQRRHHYFQVVADVYARGFVEYGQAGMWDELLASFHELLEMGVNFAASADIEVVNDAAHCKSIRCKMYAW
jgi:hypothetical protein